jgi:hypothetical protein
MSLIYLFLIIIVNKKIKLNLLFLTNLILVFVNKLCNFKIIVYNLAIMQIAKNSFNYFAKNFLQTIKYLSNHHIL